VEKTGGKNFYATASNFEPLFRALAEDVTSSYAVAIYPSDDSAPGRRREVRIESRSGLIVRQNRNNYVIGR
jgi:hypothetical protein